MATRQAEKKTKKPRQSKRKKRRAPLLAFTHWLYRRRANIIFVAVIAIVLFWLFGTRFVTIGRLLTQRQNLRAQLAEEKTRTVRLDETASQIGTRHYIEYIAHKNLRLYYPDERIIVQVTKKQAQAKKKSN